MKKYILYSRIIITSQSDNILNYIIRYLGDEENNEILIERRLYSKLKKTLKRISFAYQKVISDKISSLIRDIYRKNIIEIFVEVEEELKLTRI